MEYENISERKLQILYSAVEDYIQFATPITSGSVHEKYIQDISPATLRNELSALEAMGYLKQLHTSSGRVPTTKAYRLYVNELMKSTKFGKKELETVRDLLSKRTAYLTDVISQVAGVISQATNYPAVVVLNGYDNLPIESIKIIPLIDKSALLLIGTKNGIVNGQFNLSSGVTEEVCVDASNLLTKKFYGKTIKYMRDNIQTELVDAKNEIDSFSGLYNNLIDCLSNLISGQSHIIKVGETKLLNNPEYTDLKDAKKVLDILEDDNELKQVFENGDENEISFTIGRENNSEDLKSCSVVKANYKIGGKQIASIGVIGPERMDYSNVAGALKVIVSELNKLNLLTKTNPEGDEQN
ncbi:MAG: heat-inducible transcription repressor HrcA [Clostridia bacterium]|nr:heat-inducible transcription repressor HrcA [Clostridia bacterium]